MNYPDELLRMSLYVAPADRVIHPVTIAPECFYIELLTGGKVYFTTPDGGKKLYGRGTVFCHAAGERTICETPPEDPYRCFTALFQWKEAGRFLPRLSIWGDESILDSFTAESIRLFHQENIDSRQLCDHLAGTFRWQTYLGELRCRSAAYPPELQAVLREMELHFDSDLTVRDLALLANLSDPGLYALFRKYLAISPHQHLLNLRLRKAKTLLAASGEEIKEIALHCGFDNIESFYRAFRRGTGMSPGEYRAAQQLNV